MSDGWGPLVIVLLVLMAIVAGIVLGIVGFTRLPRELTIAGQVINNATGEWPNDRLVLIFLKGDELARTSTGIGEFRPTHTGLEDGHFEVTIPNTYKVKALRALGFHRRWWKRAWRYLEMDEGDSLEIPVPEKNVAYVVKVIPGDMSALPQPMLQPGSISLGKTGNMVVRLGESSSSEAAAQLPVQAVKTRSETDEIVLNKITVPLNNCGGSAVLEQEYIQSQTIIHEFSVDARGTVAVAVDLPVLPVTLLAELEARYGFTNGQISSRSVAYRMSANPGTNQVYVITWKEVWEHGDADMLVNDELVTVAFRVKTDLIYQVDSEAFGCP